MPIFLKKKPLKYDKDTERKIGIVFKCTTNIQPQISSSTTVLKYPTHNKIYSNTDFR